MLGNASRGTHPRVLSSSDCGASGRWATATASLCHHVVLVAAALHGSAAAAGKWRCDCFTSNTPWMVVVSLAQSRRRRVSVRNAFCCFCFCPAPGSACSGCREGRSLSILRVSLGSYGVGTTCAINRMRGGWIPELDPPFGSRARAVRRGDPYPSGCCCTTVAVAVSLIFNYKYMTST